MLSYQHVARQHQRKVLAVFTEVGSRLCKEPLILIYLINVFILIHFLTPSILAPDRRGLFHRSEESEVGASEWSGEPRAEPKGNRE